VDWHTGMVVPIFKKGDQRVCSNYQGITLFSLPGKGHARELERRLQLIVKPQIQEEQSGFRPGRGTVDQLLTLARILEGSWEFAHPVYMCFVDFKRAYNHVPWGTLWGLLQEYGVMGPLLQAIQSLYNCNESCVCILGSKSDSVDVGLHQGCPLSPILFVIFMDRISRCSWGKESVWFGDLRIDVVLLVSTHQQALGWFSAECEAAGMRVSTSKSEAMVPCQKKMDCSLWVG